VITDFNIRQALPADAPSLAELRLVFKREDEDFLEPPDAAVFLRQTESWIHDRLTNGRWLAWVAETADAICGHVFLQPVERMPDPQGDTAPIGYMTNFYVTPERRNCGIGTALLQALTDHGGPASSHRTNFWNYHSTPEDPLLKQTLVRTAPEPLPADDGHDQRDREPQPVP
jgi:GNAT superfamily N-acetyltransferase